MPAHILTAVLNGTSHLDGPYAGFSALPCSDDDVNGYYPPRWSYQRRGIRSNWDNNQWLSLWPSGSFMTGDPAQPMTLLGDDCAYGGFRLAFEFPIILGSGSGQTKFIRGQVLDNLSAPVANAIVTAFRTSDDVMVGEVTADDVGNYCVGTNNPASVQHYLVAYKTGSPPVAGTSVNTVTPTNIDGT